MKLVSFTINKYIKPSHPSEYEDYRQEGYTALCKAALNFNPNYGIKFSSYAIPAIYNAIKRYRGLNSQVKKPGNWHKSHSDVCLENIDFDTALDEDVMKKVCKKLNMTERQYMACLPAFNFSELISFESIIEIKEDTKQNVDNIIDYEKDVLNVILPKLEKLLRKSGINKQHVIDRFLDLISDSYYNTKLNCEDIEQKYGISRQAYYKSVKLCKDKLMQHINDSEFNDIRDILYTNMSIIDYEKQLDFIC